MSKLMDKLIKSSTIKNTASVDNSKMYQNSKKAENVVDTGIPMLNVALSGRLDGGLTSGLLMIAGKSKHFKTGFSMVLAAAYLNKYPDSAFLFYDCERGTPEAYFDQFGVDKSRTAHSFFTDVEQLKFDMLKQLKGLEAGDRLVTVIDSVGNAASKKEVEDAENEKSVTDMTRAKQFKSLGRIITPYIALKEVPIIAINHVYAEIGTMYPKDIVGGGTGLYLSSNDVWIIGRSQDKEGTELSGYNFVINIDKSRFVKEKSKILITVKNDGGIQKWSGLFEEALAGKFITNPKQGWYNLAGSTGANFRKSDIQYDDAFWTKMLADQKFKDYVENKYTLGGAGHDQSPVEDDELEDVE
jgi:recA bacterial DNA recombination protein